MTDVVAIVDELEGRLRPLEVAARSVRGGTLRCTPPELSGGELRLTSLCAGRAADPRRSPRQAGPNRLRLDPFVVVIEIPQLTALNQLPA